MPCEASAVTYVILIALLQPSAFQRHNAKQLAIDDAAVQMTGLQQTTATCSFQAQADCFGLRMASQATPAPSTKHIVRLYRPSASIRPGQAPAGFPGMWHCTLLVAGRFASTQEFLQHHLYLANAL